MTDIEPIENVRVVADDGTEIPVEIEYLGIGTRGSEKDKHLWQVITPLPGIPNKMTIGVLPPNTALIIPGNTVKS